MFVQSRAHKMNERRTIVPPRRRIETRDHQSRRKSGAGRPRKSTFSTEYVHIADVNIIDGDFDDFAYPTEIILKLANQD
jgi:hypothetical protein